MADQPRVRAAREDEIGLVGRLWGEMYAYQAEHGMKLALRPDAVEIFTRGLSGRLDSPVSTILVAETNGELGGFLAAQIKRLPPHLAAEKPKVGFVSEVFVRPELRRHRLGEALVSAAFAWFKRGDVGSVELHVLVENEAGRRFWERMGFSSELLQMRSAIG